MTFLRKGWLALLLVSTPVWAQQSMPTDVESLQQHSEHYQQTQLAIQQQRLDNELAQLRAEYRQWTVSADAAKKTDISEATRSTPKWLSRVEFAVGRVSLAFQPSHWRWQ